LCQEFDCAAFGFEQAGNCVDQMLKTFAKIGLVAEGGKEIP
jgi:hypothetical protein